MGEAEGTEPVQAMPDLQSGRLGAMDRQVGGSHYGPSEDLQPWDIWEAFDLNPWQANAIKYILRAGKKGPALEDYQKAAHYVQYLVEREGGQ